MCLHAIVTLVLPGASRLVGGVFAEWSSETTTRAASKQKEKDKQKTLARNWDGLLPAPASATDCSRGRLTACLPACLLHSLLVSWRRHTFSDNFKALFSLLFT